MELNEKDSYMNQLVMTGLPLNASRKDQWSFFSKNNCELLGQSREKTEHCSLPQALYKS